jgi:MFS family permease
MNYKEKKIMGLTAASHNLVHLYEGVLPPIIPLLLIEFHTDYFHMGMIVTIFSYAFGFGSLPAGYFSDRVRPGKLVSVFLLGAGGLSVCMGAANTLWVYGALMGLIGLCCSLYHPASNTLISQVMSEKGSAFGIHGIAGSLGVAIAPVLSAAIGSGLGWKSPHIIFGIMGIGVGLYSLHRSVQTPGPVAKNIPSSKRRATGLRVSLSALIVFYLSAAFLGLTYKGIMTFLPVYMGERISMEFLGISRLTLAGSFATFALISGAIGQYIGGRLVDRWRPELIYAGAICLGTVFVFLMAISSNGILIASAVMYAFFYFATQPIQNFMLSRYLPADRYGLGFGVHFFITFGVGSTAAAFSGYLADHHGLASVFYAMGGCFLASCCLAGYLILQTRTLLNPLIQDDSVS